ncbi:sigma-54 dependent transcriptional regulator [Spiribacter halobius]|uniref:Sigma-54-dependent Fis family transcriptional regulator n=1 Tax=Sediminicurvatus halobius TaxID=2182432 RepID=A0A2U2N6M9_9GAMM|nr:sigma-54 dependent transcriptional regulator [Spiribacter halobius]PWG64845.1 sigma-54-dependent Fis family transcriptional regulator [Spiribacter halobius]UEX79945.1 sigma-54 dependent transcriptional regulator [Spiribacter halobius]
MRLAVLQGAGDTGLVAVDALRPEWDVQRCANLNELSAALHERTPQVVLFRADEALVPLESLEGLVAGSPLVQWIALVTPEELEDPRVRRLVAQTCTDYQTLPLDAVRLRHTVGHAAGMGRLRARVMEGVTSPSELGLVGASPVMLKLMRGLEKVAAVDAPVLVHGETGTGKELVARAIHARSSRRRGPFVAVNCGALPPTLIHSELFGHERGAFTGAASRRIGRIETARGGTVFLDEIGDLSAELQSHLLRFLEESTIERLGNGDPIRVDARVIAATHVDLEGAVAEGRFREDLYYRLNVLRLDTPPLRERGDDIELLARFFFQRYRSESAPGVRGFSREAIAAMQQHPWPGNVRELLNRVRRALVMSERRLIGAADLGLDRRARPRRQETLERARIAAEREAVLGSLRANRNNVTRAAQQLGVSRVTLYRLLDKHGLRSHGAAEAQ